MLVLKFLAQFVLCTCTHSFNLKFWSVNYHSSPPFSWPLCLPSVSVPLSLCLSLSLCVCVCVCVYVSLSHQQVRTWNIDLPDVSATRIKCMLTDMGSIPSAVLGHPNLDPSPPNTTWALLCGHASRNLATQLRQLSGARHLLARYRLLLQFFDSSPVHGLSVFPLVVVVVVVVVAAAAFFPPLDHPRMGARALSLPLSLALPSSLFYTPRICPSSFTCSNLTCTACQLLPSTVSLLLWRWVMVLAAWYISVTFADIDA
jgi:hypothetical protein